MKCEFCDWERVLTDPFYHGFSEVSAMVAISTDYTNHLLVHLIKTLQEMKQQERDYWETWKQAKSSEKEKVG